MKHDPILWTDAGCEFLNTKLDNLHRKKMFKDEPKGVHYNLG